jgi:hypothetical protein
MWHYGNRLPESFELRSTGTFIINVIIKNLPAVCDATFAAVDAKRRMTDYKKLAP